jgi:F-type H+-transporting ATPase subunit b
MKFDIWTFFFQVINFVVLLFILKRLLYRPVREILQKRRDLVRETLEKAERMQKEALELKERHSREMDKLGGLRERMTEEMKAEVLEEKKRLLAAADEEAAMRIERATVLFDLEKTRFQDEMKDKSIETVRIFTANLLHGVADEELHRGVWRRFLIELDGISRDMAGRGLKEETVMVDLISAFPMPEEDLDMLRNLLEGGLSRKVTINPAVDGALIAGVKIRLSDMVYDASLSGQVDSFVIKLRESV